MIVRMKSRDGAAFATFSSGLPAVMGILQFYRGNARCTTAGGMPEKSTRESDPTPSRPSGPTDSQLEAAIDGARDMVESRRTTNDGDYTENAQRGGAGGAQGGGSGSAQGAGTSTAGPSEMPSGNPAVETGGPRGSGYPPSRTSGGRLDPDGDPHGVEPDEAIKRSTGVKKNTD
jgi:hypothetical protein